MADCLLMRYRQIQIDAAAEGTAGSGDRQRGNRGWPESSSTTASATTTGGYTNDQENRKEHQHCQFTLSADPAYQDSKHAGKQRRPGVEGRRSEPGAGRGGCTYRERGSPARRVKCP